MAGVERQGKDNKPIVPTRKALLSHWLADLHSETKLSSAVTPLCGFLLEKLSDLEKYHEFFVRLQEEGRVALIIGWFNESNHSAELLDARTLKKCGEMGIDLEINFYSPSSQIGL